MAGQVFNKVLEFFTPDPYPPLCPMPGCNKQCFVENNGHVHDFCGKTHAREYKAMKDAQKQQRMMRDKRLKAVQYGQSGGGHGGGWQGQHSYASVACAAQYGTGPSCTRSGTPYGAHSMVNQPTMMKNHYGDVGQGPIRFYNRDEPYYEFTNFYPAPIDLDGSTWPTTEHYFQAQKFIGTSYPEMIRRFDRPRQAFDLSRNPTVSRWRRKDWEDIKIDVMRKALLAKFTQHKRLRQMLLSTGDNMLIEHTPYDKFWGDGGDGNGENHLGLLLMEIRHDLKNLQASLRQENSHAEPRVNPDSHREHIQRSESTEKDGQSGLSSSSSSCSMEYTNAGANKSNQNQRNNPGHQEVNNSDDLTRPPLHPVATENTGPPPCQPLAATGGEGSPQTMASDPPVGNLIDFDDAGLSEKDEVTPMMMDNVPTDLAKPLQPTPPAPIQCTTHAGRYITQPAPDTSTDVGKEPASSNKDNHSEKMETDDSNNIH